MLAPVVLGSVDLRLLPRQSWDDEHMVLITGWDRETILEMPFRQSNGPWMGLWGPQGIVSIWKYPWVKS